MFFIQHTCRTRSKEIKVKKREVKQTTIARNIYRKSCASLYKENWRLYVNFQSKRGSKMVIFAQMKPAITNLNLNNLITYMKLYNYVVKRELAILKAILSEQQLNASRNCSDVVKFRARLARLLIVVRCSKRPHNVFSWQPRQ